MFTSMESEGDEEISRNRFLRLSSLSLTILSAVFFFGAIYLLRSAKSYPTHFMRRRHSIIFSTGNIQVINKTFYEHFEYKSSQISIFDSYFYYCRQNSLKYEGGDGGAIFITAITSIIENCIFRGNFASHNGGALYIKSVSSSLLKNTIFDHNLAGHFSGGVFCFNVFSFLVENSNFSFNAAQKVSSLSISYCPRVNTNNLIFFKNDALDYGTMLIENSIFSDVASLFSQNSAGITTSIKLNGNTKCDFTKIKFFDQANYSMTATPTDEAVLHECFLTRDSKLEFNENEGKIEISGFTISQQIKFNYNSLPPIPTYHEISNITIIPTTELQDNLPLGIESKISPSSPQWKVMMIILYTFAIVLLAHAVKQYISVQNKASTHQNEFDYPQIFSFENEIDGRKFENI
ncbi:hypothetical protein TRFO_24622 [Tritrichomonas foetus]|uniref:Right handed beta helix domain-containing protein n=1 Tax=Tritrichomonas foetus TaxID=1144522 RepID=A0A1J4K8J0_9EUKA|nr:hypothetical protein TRFO_24622 [Tritrichomonas foetus]|eukprot:OHT07282.1 hypothetical protein TRFO_24622 [Tritrichomonas foetus]